MQYRKELLRQLPAMDVLLQCDEAAKLIDEYSYKAVLFAFRQATDFVRNKIISDNIEKCSANEIINIAKKCCLKKFSRHKKVINCSGTVLHTNLGRSVFEKLQKQLILQLIIMQI